MKGDVGRDEGADLTGRCPLAPLRSLGRGVPHISQAGRDGWFRNVHAGHEISPFSPRTSSSVLPGDGDMEVDNASRLAEDDGRDVDR